MPIQKTGAMPGKPVNSRTGRVQSFALGANPGSLNLPPTPLLPLLPFPLIPLSIQLRLPLKSLNLQSMQVLFFLLVLSHLDLTGVLIQDAPHT